MADLFNFGGFIKNTNKRREKAAGLTESESTSEDKTETTESVPKGTMSQSEFSYGSEGMRRKPKAVPPARMKP